MIIWVRGIQMISVNSRLALSARSHVARDCHRENVQCGCDPAVALLHSCAGSTAHRAVHRDAGASATFWNILEHAQVFQIKTAGARLYDRSKQTDTRSGTSLFQLIRSVAIRFGYLVPVRLGAPLA
jgi:hypothetical protein